MKTLLTPKDKKENLKQRLAAVLALLPDSWVKTFIHVFPEYSDKGTFLYNLARGKSLDENVIEKMEQLAENLKPKTA